MTDTTQTTDAEFSSPMEFPCDFMIKAMGKNNDTFINAVTKIIRDHFPALEDKQITHRPSKDGNYTAITAKVYAESKDQLDNLYQALSSEPSVLMAL
jgi:putative lipoic acid-binding regulatory protein